MAKNGKRKVTSIRHPLLQKTQRRVDRGSEVHWCEDLPLFHKWHTLNRQPFLSTFYTSLSFGNAYVTLADNIQRVLLFKVWYVLEWPEWWSLFDWLSRNWKPNTITFSKENILQKGFLFIELYPRGREFQFREWFNNKGHKFEILWGGVYITNSHLSQMEMIRGVIY